MPTFIQILSMIRYNSFLTHREHDPKKAMAHKKFTLSFIEELMIRAGKCYYKEVEEKGNSGDYTPSPADDISIHGAKHLSQVSSISSTTTFTSTVKSGF